MEESTATEVTQAVSEAPTTDWRTSLSEDLRGAPALQSFKDINGLSKSYLEAQSMLGSSLRFPSKEAGAEDIAAFRAKVLERGKDYGITMMPGDSPEEQAKFYAALGVPDNEDGYELPEIAGDDDVSFDPTEAMLLRSTAKELGLTKKQYKGLVEVAAKGRMEAARGEVQAVREAQRQLKTEWGEAFDQRMHGLTEFLSMNGAPAGLVDAVKGGNIDPGSAKWLYGIMEAMGGEASEITNQGKTGQNSIITPSEANDRAEEIFRKMQDMNPGSAEYQELMKKRVDYIRRAG